MTRNFHWFGSLGLLKPGVTFEQAQKDMDAIGARIATDFPDSNKGWGVGLDLYKNIFINDSLRTSVMTLPSCCSAAVRAALSTTFPHHRRSCSPATATRPGTPTWSTTR